MQGQPTPKNLLLTGPPGCGKTTAVLRLVERLAGHRLAGFYTTELRECGCRVGFEAVGICTGQHALLAHVRSKSMARVGKYGVEPAALAPLVQAELETQAGGVDLFVIDEIGRMELFCPQFVDAVSLLLGGPVPLLATVAMKGGGLIADAKARPDVRLVEVTPGNRDTLPGELEAWAKTAGRKGA
jgi:nucleoside-triphosphatase